MPRTSRCPPALDLTDALASVGDDSRDATHERQREIEQFWLDQLRLPRTQLRKTILNNYSKHSQKKRKNKLPYGTCKLVLNSTQVVQTIYGSIQEYGGFERPEWLD